MSESRAIIAFPFEEAGEVQIENMYGVPAGGDSYILDNSPFHVYDVSYLDTVRATHDGERLVFREVLARGGHSTYRVRLPNGANHNYFLRAWPYLESQNCSYEGSSTGGSRVYSIDVPQTANIIDVYSYLENKEQEGFWEFEEAYYYDAGANHSQ